MRNLVVSIFLSFFVVNFAFAQFQLKSFTPENFQAGNVTLTTAKHALMPSEMALVVNTQDPQSVQVANYYKVARKIPDANVINVSFAHNQGNMDGASFNAMRATVLSRMPLNVQAIAISWTSPWRVDCMSLTSAFAFGFDTAFCQPVNGEECNPTPFSNYFNSSSKNPKKDFSIYPTMMLAGVNFDQVKALIDRGLNSDLSFPKGDGYMLTTTDQFRNVRQGNFDYAATVWSDSVNSLKISHIDNSDGHTSDYLYDVSNMLFYFTGTYMVYGLETLKFIPGAIGDHLTSYGGVLLNSPQMSALNWLEAGATGSYGTVVEPCNYTTKFPDPGSLYPFYFSGESLVESYWKSVAMPSEGIFVGEPLARPWGTKFKALSTGEHEVYTTLMKANKKYYLLTPTANDLTKYNAVQTFNPTTQKFQSIKFTAANNKYYLLSEDEVTKVNNPPSIIGLSDKTVYVNNLLSFQVNAKDPDGDKLSFSASNLPTGAKFNQQTGVFSWTPSSNQAGIYRNVTFKVSDGSLSDTKSITITVLNVNRPPVITPITNQEVQEGRTLSFNVIASDPDGDKVTLTASNLPSGASFNSSTFTWPTIRGQAGVYFVTFTANDGSLSSFIKVQITVRGGRVLPPPPVDVFGPRLF